MGVSGGASENIAIGITTAAELSGTRAARADVTALGKDAIASAQQMQQASTSASAAETTLAGATAKASQETGKLKVSADQMRDALAKTGGDLTKAAALLASMATAETAAASGATALGLAATEAAIATNAATTAAQGAAVASTSEANALGTVAAAATKAATATDQLSAADERAIRQMGLAEVAAYKEDAARAKALGTVQKVPGGARTAANSLGILSQAALTGSGSFAGMAAAAGGMATGLASVTDNAKLAAGAAGIGALITVGVILFETYRKAKQEIVTTANAQFLQHIGSETLKQAEADLKAVTVLRDKAQQNAAEKATGDIRDIIPHTEAYEAEKAYETQVRNVEALTAKVAELRHQERIRQIELAQSARDEIAANRLVLTLETDRAGHKKNDYQLSLEANENDRKQQAADIVAQFRHRDANGQIVALTGEEVRLRGTLLDQENKIADAKGRQLHDDYIIALNTAKATQLQGSDNVTEQVQGRLEAIEIERRAEIQKLGDVATATAAAEQKKRQLYRETASVANDNAKSILDVLRSTNNTTLRAVGTFGENLRRVVIGAEAAKALVRAATEGAEAIASLAVGDFRGAALHGAAAVQFGAAAALGARESLGGGGSGGSGGGGGSSAGSGGGGSTFSPRGGSDGSPVVVNLYTTDPYNRENIMIASYQLNRAGITKRPIYLPPTSGLTPATA